MIRRASLLLLLLGGCARSEAPPPELQDREARNAAVIDRYRQPEQLLDALQIQPGQRVADVGAGTGYLTTRLARRVGPSGQVVATDIDEQVLARLRARVADLPQVQVRRVRAEEPGLEPGAYDLVLLSQVDHLLPRAPCYFAALLRSLRPGGRVAVTNAERHEAGLRRTLAQLPVRAAPPPLVLQAQFLLVLVRDPDSPVRIPDTCP